MKNSVHRRKGHTATLLQNGKVLIAGGNSVDNNNLNTAELFDPDSEQFTTLSNRMLGFRSYYTATLLGNGTVLFAGGWDNNDSRSTEIFDPDTQTFISTENMTTVRAYGTAAVLLQDGSVIVIGGTNADQPTQNPGLKTAEIYR